MDLLIERFNVPDPETPVEESESLRTRETLKRFRKEYVRHVHLRYGPSSYHLFILSMNLFGACWTEIYNIVGC